jgi:hypothetical protein
VPDKDKYAKQDPKDKPVLPPSKAREETDKRGKTSRPTIAKRKGQQVIREKKKKGR